MGNLLKDNAGFSLLEIAMVVALMTMLAAFGMPIFNNFKVSNDLDTTRNTLVHSLRRAQGLSQMMENDSSWGVFVQSGEMVLFKGSSYAVRDVDYDESSDMLTTFQVTGINEIVFSKLAGLPSITGDIIITSNSNENRTININSKGMVSY